HHVDTPDAQRAVEAVALGEVTDLAPRVAGGAAEHPGSAGLEGEQTEDHLDQRRLADAVGAQHGDELAVADRDIDVSPDGSTADADGGTGELDGGHRRVPEASAARNASSWRVCQSWNEA